MNIKRPDPVNSKPAEKSLGSVPSGTNTVQDESGASLVKEEELLTSNQKNILCSELLTFRSLIEKLACVDQGNYAWTWDHENSAFLLQAQNNIIEQYVRIMTNEMGDSLCLPLQRATIIVDLRPWQSNADKTSLRIGFEESSVPDELCGHTGLEDLTNLHFTSGSENSPEIKEALAKVKRMCAQTDDLFENKYDWMWETHWKPNGLAFAVVQKNTWESSSALMEKEIERFNNSPKIQQAGLRIGLSTYNRGTSFNVRIALEGWPADLLQYTRILDAFDTHFSGSTG
jgi:hypothetical protein